MLKYKIILKANNTEYKSSGATMHEALTNLPLDYTQCKTKGTLVISKGKKSVEKFMYFLPLKQLLANKLRKQGYARQFEALINAV